jgi:hypothetical protein
MRRIAGALATGGSMLFAMGLVAAGMTGLSSSHDYGSLADVSFYLSGGFFRLFGDFLPALEMIGPGLVSTVLGLWLEQRT